MYDSMVDVKTITGDSDASGEVSSEGGSHSGAREGAEERAEQRPVSTSLKLYGRSTMLISIIGTVRSASTQWSRLNSCWPRPEDRDAGGHLCLKDDKDDHEVERDSCFLVGCAGVITNVKVSRKFL
jgi:hypothetical protein